MSLKLALCAAILLLGFELPAQAHDNYSPLTSRSGNRCCEPALAGARVDLALVLAVDVSGDGANNTGRTVTLARDEALAHGITINGLPIMLKRPDSLWDIEDLDLYFHDCVIGGPGAFLVPVREKGHFIEAIKAKIIREITDQSLPQPLVQPAQAVSSKFVGHALPCGMKRAWSPLGPQNVTSHR